MPWTKSNLREIVKDRVGDHKFLVVSNREPYIHSYAEEGIVWRTPASGMTVALSPVMMACGGTWIAAAQGDADREVVDDKDHLPVPPNLPSYTLRRVWLNKEQEDNYYYGYSNEGIWPLCHIVHVRPTFRERDWQAYRQVNELFAEVVLQEMGNETGFVFIQDYHFALLPRLIKDRRPDIVTAQFWHIPWPNPEAFRICPQAEDILDGLLGNDILGFHTRYHGLNFLDSVDRFLESRVDRERSSVVRGGRETLVRPYPISIDFEALDQLAQTQSIEARVDRIKRDFRLKDKLVGVGIDRMDYTKGIVERFEAVDRFLEKYPDYCGRFVFLQLGPLSRIQIPKYREYNDEVYNRMVEINKRWKGKGWVPIILHKEHLGLEDVLAYYRAADVCIVSPIHDGMNLVSKEFVSSRFDGRGVLILSQFAGSSRELGQALLINPVATDQFAEAIKQALSMPREEQTDRLQKMRETVRENNVYRWAGKIVNEMKKLM